MESEQSAIKRRLQELLPPFDERPVVDAARYALFPCGKMIRSTLLLRVAKAFGGDETAAIDIACALEMLHTYSLVHDDLPCMDNAETRRGRETLHKKYPEWLALLAGDFLLTKTFETISNAPLCDEKKVALLQVAAKRGGDELIDGQVRDLLGEMSDVMIEGKTCALFSAAFEMGGIIAGVAIEPLATLGKKLGLLYQLSDDLDDHDGMALKYGEEAIRNRCETLYAHIVQKMPKNLESVEEIIAKWWLSKV